jgi:hypothetical protein
MPTWRAVKFRDLLILGTLAVSGCTGGLGASTAATRPLFGQTMSNDDAKMWVVSSNQSHVPAGMVRVEQVSDGFARVFNYVSIVSAVRKGSKTATINGTAQEASDDLELELSLLGRIPLPVGGLTLGAGRVMTIDDDNGLDGFGVRASFAPIGQFSIDFAHSWVKGTYTVGSTETDTSGTRTSLGGTLLLWGYNTFRFGIYAAKTWTSADPYTSNGYTWSLVSTMY